MQHITRKTLKNFVVSVPESYTEQTQIAEVLAMVDRALATTAALVAKHERIKTGLMQDLLARGLDERSQLRDPQTHRFQPSPLGDIPEEWKVVELGQVLNGIRGGKSPDCPDEPAQGNEWGVLKVSAIGRGIFLAHENKRVNNPLFINSNYQVRKGDLLISRSNTPELVGLVCLFEEQPNNLMLCDKTLRLEVNQNCANKFFINKVLATPLVRSQIEIAATGSSGSMKNLSQPAIRSIRFLLPPKPEQDQIVAQIQAVERLVKSHQTQHSKMQCLKTGLMADLLSGRVPVASLAATL